MILGQHQIITILPSNRGMNSRPFNWVLPRTGLSDHIHSNGLITPTILQTEGAPEAGELTAAAGEQGASSLC